LIGSIVLWLIPIPYIGMIVAGLWSLAVRMVVFEKVDGIERLQAFALSFGVGFIFMVLTLMLFAPKP